MKVSVVVPAYNEERYIGACLKSLEKQEEKPDEIIVVDNNSSDKTADIARKYPVRVIHEKKQGIIPTRDKGFNEAKFEIIARTDADTVVSSKWVKSIKEIMQDPEVVGATGPTLFNIQASRYTRGVNNFFYFFINKPFLKSGCFIGPNMVLRQNIWNKIKDEACLNEKDIHEDLDLSIHAGNYGKIVYDKRLVTRTSGRRLKDMESMLFRYPYKWVHTIYQHRATL